jgi:hypothetical protein
VLKEVRQDENPIDLSYYEVYKVVQRLIFFLVLISRCRCSDPWNLPQGVPERNQVCVSTSRYQGLFPYDSGFLELSISELVRFL